MTSNAFDKLRASFSETSLPVVYVDLAHILVLAVLPIAAGCAPLMTPERGGPCTFPPSHASRAGVRAAP